MLSDDQKKIRNLTKYLRALCKATRSAFEALDSEMKKPSTEKRVRNIARICNFLELNTDMAERYGLGKKFKGEK